MTKTILLCDDEASIMRAAEFKLTRAGYRVRCACDGEEGWREILAQRPDLVVTDCQMPRLDGLQLAARIQGTPEMADLPVVMLTGKGFEASYRESAARWGVLRVLAKPFSPRELLKLVGEIVGPAQPAQETLA